VQPRVCVKKVKQLEGSEFLFRSKMENVVNNIISFPNGPREITSVGRFFEFEGSCEFWFFKYFRIKELLVPVL
jgi:hypothetical protein